MLAIREWDPNVLSLSDESYEKANMKRKDSPYLSLHICFVNFPKQCHSLLLW